MQRNLKMIIVSFIVLITISTLSVGAQTKNSIYGSKRNNMNSLYQSDRVVHIRNDMDSCMYDNYIHNHMYNYQNNCFHLNNMEMYKKHMHTNRMNDNSRNTKDHRKEMCDYHVRQREMIGKLSKRYSYHCQRDN